MNHHPQGNETTVKKEKKRKAYKENNKSILNGEYNKQSSMENKNTNTSFNKNQLI